MLDLGIQHATIGNAHQGYKRDVFEPVWQE
jgi:hypothetical protein